MTQNEKKIVAIIITGVLISTGVFFVFIFSEDSSNEIINRCVQSLDDIVSYRYLSEGTLLDNYTFDGGTSDMSGTSYVTGCTFNLQNREMFGWGQSEPTDDTVDEEILDLYNTTYYFANNTLFSSLDEIQWSSFRSPNDWYSLSHLERLLLFFINNATFEQLNNEVVDNSECFVIRVLPSINDAELRQTFFDFILPFRFEESGDDFAYSYDTDIRYWIEKDSYLMKKAHVKAIYNLRYSYIPYSSTERIKRHYCWNYTTDISFYDYNTLVKIESPWKKYKDNATAALSHLEYSNTDFGFGFNPPSNWTMVKSIGFMSYPSTPLPTFQLINESMSNLSCMIWPPSHSMVGNFSEVINYTMEKINELVNQSLWNETLVSHMDRTVNEMNAYEFVLTYNRMDGEKKRKELFVENEGRIFKISIEGYSDLYDEKSWEMEQSVNSSFMIVAPYFEILD